MALPLICTILADAEERAALERDLVRRFSADYDIATQSSPDEALKDLDRWRMEGREVALILADVWLPRMTGIELLTQAHDLHPQAKRCLFLAYGDTMAGPVIYQAVTLGRIDDYFLRPWGTPDERLYPMVTLLLGAWSRTNRPTFETVRVLGDPFAARSHELIDLLTRNSIPHGLGLFRQSCAVGIAWEHDTRRAHCRVGSRDRQAAVGQCCAAGADRGVGCPARGCAGATGQRQP